MPKYKRIANKFMLGSIFKEYHGPVIASREAFYLVVNVSAAAAMGGVVGGLVGVAIAGVLSGGKKEQTDVLDIDLAELHPDILRDPDWPIRQQTGRVILIPRGAIKKIKYPWWGSLDIQTAERRFSICPMVFYRGGVVRFLRENEWDV
ncbi:hypothetical protein GC197_03070 [bacterium]|nr:hypothetical protein [bacterium]